MKVNTIRIYNLKVGTAERKDKIATLQKQIKWEEQIDKTLADVDQRFKQEMTKISTAHLEEKKKGPRKALNSFKSLKRYSSGCPGMALNSLIIA